MHSKLKISRDFTKTPNGILESLACWPHSPASLKVMLYLIRQTLGWNREVTRRPFDRGAVAQATGLNKSSISRAMTQLRKNNYITFDSESRVVLNVRRFQPPTPSVIRVRELEPADSNSVTPQRRIGDIDAAHALGDQSVSAAEIQSNTTKDIRTLARAFAVDEGNSPAIWELQLQAVMEEFTSRFRVVDSSGVLTESDCGKLIKMAYQSNVSPLWVIRQIPAGHPAPKRCLYKFIHKPLRLPDMPDHEKRNSSWSAWRTSITARMQLGKDAVIGRSSIVQTDIRERPIEGDRW